MKTRIAGARAHGSGPRKRTDDRTVAARRAAMILIAISTPGRQRSVESGESKEALRPRSIHPALTPAH